jgi:hypothetical protein
MSIAAGVERGTQLIQAVVSPFMGHTGLSLFNALKPKHYMNHERQEIQTTAKQTQGEMWDES